MQDEEYRPDQIGAYGAAVQEAVVERMRPHLRLTTVGVAIGVVAVALQVAALVTFPTFGGEDSSPAAVITALVSGVLLLLVAGFQLSCWRVAFAEWSGGVDRQLDRLARFSYVVHWVSYPVVVVGLLAAITASQASGWSSTSAFLTAGGLLAMIGSQVLAGVQYLRTAGPPGTVPEHMRKLIARERARAARG